MLYVVKLTDWARRVGIHPKTAADLDRQLCRLAARAADHRFQVVRTEAEVGSGLTGRRRRLMRVLAEAAIVVEHRDRLARFGVEYIEPASSGHRSEGEDR